MQKVMQKRFVEKDGHGDCWRACIASIIECDIDKLPDPNKCNGWPDIYSKTQETLEKMGFTITSYPVQTYKSRTFDFDGRIIAIGKSPRSTEEKRINHAVVWFNGIIHDPHPDNTGILDIVSFEEIERIYPKHSKTPSYPVNFRG
jgi:hypothetical protein